MNFKELAATVKGQLLQMAHNRPVNALVTDSRKPVVDEGSVFFAIKGERHDGHRFIPEVYRLGIRQFVVESAPALGDYPDANILQVDSSLKALQQWVITWRKQWRIPVVGITGSNGKTTIKEWLYQLLSPDFRIAKSPGSYNSQLGVPLSVWGLNAHHQLGIFEAGVSKAGEMEKLREIMQPTLGIFTNLGGAHDEGFASREAKAEEKALLFRNCECTIYCRDHTAVHAVLERHRIPVLAWGSTSAADIHVEELDGEHFKLTFKRKSFTLTMPFRDRALRENAFHVIAFLLLRGYDAATIQERIAGLHALPMRLELKQGVHRSLIIDDSYNNDLAGLTISLDFLRSQQKEGKTVILSDILQSGLSPEKLISQVASLLKGESTDLIGIGPMMMAHQEKLGPGRYFPSTEEFIKNLDTSQFADRVVLVKGARPFRFERIVHQLQRKVHGTVMEVDLTAMVHNLNHFKARLRPGTKTMAMVKAFAYGSGSEEVANLLQFHRVDYLGVAFADEGVDLRKNNITLPIMVMNPTDEGFAAMLQHNLEPEVYSLRVLKGLVQSLNKRECKIHLKLDTGMHRLGFEADDLPELESLLRSNPHLKVASIFTHLSGADEKAHDDFSHQQVKQFMGQD